MAGQANNATDDKSAKSKEPPKSKLQSFLEFLYNKEEHKVLGRTGKSWFEITIFYVIFYSCLAGFFAANLAIFLQTLNDETPRYYGKGSIIGINPGLGYQPWLKDNAESTLIKFNQDDPSTYEKYTKALKDFFRKYNVTEDNKKYLRHCDGREQSNKEDVAEACIFSLKDFINKGCGPPHFGFDRGDPCVVLTLNKLIAWEPVRYPEGSLPSTLPPQVKSHYNGDIAISCEGEYYADQENIGRIQYIPESGIQRKFFPYKVMKSYQQPFAMVKFQDLKRGVLAEVECKAYAYNIIHDRANRLGMVHFELFKLNVEPPRTSDESGSESSADGS